MIRVEQKDITTVESGIVCHGVNCQGVMGSGVALAIREKWPKVYSIYRQERFTTDQLGTVSFVNVSDNLIVANCYTQQFYGASGKYASLEAIRTTICKVALRSSILGNVPIYLPRIGADRGGLDWNSEVLPLLTDISEQFNDVEFIICEFCPTIDLIK